MAIIPIGRPTWAYDSTNKTLNLIFVEPCRKGESDPAKWVAEWDYILSIPFAGLVSKVPHAEP